MKTSLLFVAVALMSGSEFAAPGESQEVSSEKLIRECKGKAGELDTYSKSLLRISLAESGNEYGGYRVSYLYELGGMGGAQKIDRTWDGLFCRLYRGGDFDCQQLAGSKPVRIVAKAGRLNVLEATPVLSSGLTTSEGNSLVFDKPVGTCN